MGVPDNCLWLVHCYTDISHSGASSQAFMQRINQSINQSGTLYFKNSSRQLLPQSYFEHARKVTTHITNLYARAPDTCNAHPVNPA